jgi:hypothetical protein
MPGSLPARSKAATGKPASSTKGKSKGKSPGMARRRPILILAHIDDCASKIVQIAFWLIKID